jgi:hypothetical protein
MKKCMLAASLLLLQCAANAQSLAPSKPDVEAASIKPAARSTCAYEGKEYSEGAVKQVGQVPLVCVERDWGTTFDTPGKPRELVWEPLSSQRLSQFRRITGLPASIK